MHAVPPRAQQKEPEDEPEEAGGLRRALTIAGAVAAAVALAVLLWSVIFSDLFGGEQTPTEYEVPDLLGMTIAEAEADERVKGIFTIEQIGQRASSEYDAGQIIEQSPEKGKSVKGNRVISVFISTGIKSDKMPNLVNTEYRNATIQLKNLDLDLVISEPVEEYSDSINSGYIIRTIPEYNETLKEGDAVTLIVSKGPEKKPIKVLTFTSLDIDTARQLATQSGLVVAEVTSRPDGMVASGIVLEQSIAPDTTVTEGAKISFVISAGPVGDSSGEAPSAAGDEEQP